MELGREGSAKMSLCEQKKEGVCGRGARAPRFAIGAQLLSTRMARDVDAQITLAATPTAKRILRVSNTQIFIYRQRNIQDKFTH